MLNENKDQMNNWQKESLNMFNNERKSNNEKKYKEMIEG